MGGGDAVRVLSHGTTLVVECSNVHEDVKYPRAVPEQPDGESDMLSMTC